MIRRVSWAWQLKAWAGITLGFCNICLVLHGSWGSFVIMQVLYGDDLIDPITMCPGHDKKTKMQKDILATRMAGRTHASRKRMTNTGPRRADMQALKRCLLFP